MDDIVKGIVSRCLHGDKEIMADEKESILQCLSSIHKNKKIRKKDVSKSDFAFVSNTCIGRGLDRVINKEYRSPFIGTIIPDDYDFLKLCENYDYYLNMKPIFVESDMNRRWHKITGNRIWNEKIKIQPYPIMRLDDIDIHWIHCSLGDKNKIINNFMRRKERGKLYTPCFLLTEKYLFLNLEEPERSAYLNRFANIPGEKLMLVGNGYEREESFICHTNIDIHGRRDTNNTLKTSLGGRPKFFEFYQKVYNKELEKLEEWEMDMILQEEGVKITHP